MVGKYIDTNMYFCYTIPIKTKQAECSMSSYASQSNEGRVKFRRSNSILFLPVLFFMDLKIFLPVILEGSLSLDLMFCNLYLHSLDVNISHVEHDFPQLKSAKETDSIDAFIKINCSKTSWSETKETSVSLTAFPYLNKISLEHFVQQSHF